MNSLISNNLEQIRSLCEKHGLKELYIFGSAARDDFDCKQSDLDFLIDFGTMLPAERAEAYVGVLEGLEKLFNLSIDLVVYQAIENPYFLREVDSCKVKLYAA